MYNSFSINWNRLYDISKSLINFNIDHEIQDIDDMYEYIIIENRIISEDFDNDKSYKSNKKRIK